MKQENKSVSFRHGRLKTCAVKSAYAPRTSRQERRGVLECIALKKSLTV